MPIITKTESRHAIDSDTAGNNSPIISGSGHHVTINQTVIESPICLLKQFCAEGPKNDYEREIYNSLFATNTAPVTLSFQSDSLCLARLVNQLSRNGNFGSEYIVFVDGYDNLSKTSVKIFGSYSSGVLDGYVRNIEVEVEVNRIVDVGGSNATLERIAASNVDVVMSREVYDNILNPYLPFYRSDEKCCYDSNTLIAQFKYEQVESVVAIARRLGDEQSLKMMLQYLNRNFEPRIMEFIAEGFRSFERLCLRNQELSRQATAALILFIKKNAKSAELALSIIYAIESLGYVSLHNSEAKKMACLFLLRLIRSDLTLYAHRDVLWAALVSIDRTFSTTVDLGMIKKLAEESTNYREIMIGIAEDINEKSNKLNSI